MALFTIESDFRYEIVRKIFEGGMGIVFEAEQHGARDFVKRVAIKIIRPNFASQKMFLENFIGEAKLVADLIHTNIVQTYHLGETNGVCFICMELIRGVNLEQFTRQIADGDASCRRNWPCSSPAASRAGWPTRTRRPTRTANRWASSTAT